ncbi:MAG: diacylglycerol O-acyltransferase / wax synthase [Acidimicrobiaceae bacterium]|nr:diacylglycerol O-acyltransferase / wax synthase [Acidimicrobiaceae bacterium]
MPLALAGYSGLARVWRRLRSATRWPIGFAASRGNEANIAQLGNQVGVMAVTVPTSGRPFDRLIRISGVTSQHKTEVRGDSVALIAPVFRLLALLGILRWLNEHQHLVTTFVSNLRDPDKTVSFLGSIVSEVIPLTSVSGNVSVAFAVLSYAGPLL